MKKSIIALSLVSAFAAPAFALSPEGSPIAPPTEKDQPIANPVFTKVSQDDAGNVFYKTGDNKLVRIDSKGGVYGTSDQLVGQVEVENEKVKIISGDHEFDIEMKGNDLTVTGGRATSGESGEKVDGDYTVDYPKQGGDNMLPDDRDRLLDAVTDNSKAIDDTNKKIKEVGDELVGAINDTNKKIDDAVNNIDKGLDNTNKRVDDVANGLDKVSDKVADNANHNEAQDKAIGDNTKRLDEHEDAIKGAGKAINDTNKKIDDAVNNIDKGLDNTNKRVDDVANGLDKVSDKVADNANHNEAQDKAIDDTNKRLDNTNKKIEEVGGELSDAINGAREEAAGVNKKVDDAIAKGKEVGKKLSDEIGDMKDDANRIYERDVAKANKAYAETTARIDGLEKDLFLFKEETEQRFNEMDDRIDGTNAALHAVTNARPMVTNGQTAFGAGVGFAGSAQAVAVGVAHSFEDSGWSASATVNYSNGSYSSDLSAGAGVQYSF
ncbi:YadA-like family protein [Vibrio atypicus]|uniref:YadA-like family protein n=1 Tax=Vibrio atypicus TaxID=558271 RepID=UPI001CED852D|nr:YadA-like family protein [Vibrio atypicus]